jgi:PAS domain S-box-containing protein
LPSNLVGRSITTIPVVESDMTRAALGIRELLDTGSWQGNLSLGGAPGEATGLQLRAALLRHEDGRPIGVIAVLSALRDLSLVQERAAMQIALLDELDVSVVVTDARRNVLTWNTGAEQLYGWTREEAVGSWLPRLVAPNEDLGEFISAGLSAAGRVDGEMMARRKDGSTLPVYARTRVVSDRHGAPAFYYSVSMDISERHAAHRGLIRTRNQLRAVTDIMGDGLFTVDDEGRILYLNRAARQAFGYSLDQLRGRPVSQLLGASAPSEAPAAGLFRALRDRRTVRVEEADFACRDGRRLPVSYSAAPFETEEGVQGAVIVFQDLSNRLADARKLTHDLEKLAWVRRVQEALRDGGLVLHAQPIVTLDTGEVIQHELLIRLEETQAGETTLIAPGVFLPIAEEYGFIGQIDRWVIDQAAGLAADGLAVEVNVSAATIGDLSFLDHVELALLRTGADPGLIVFEITETGIMGDQDAAKSFINRLHELGCRIALDDFGTGYGGFTYLKHLSVDILKIDIEFVRDLQVSVSSQKVVRAVVDLARGFGVLTVAEGVEDEVTLNLLREFGVDLAQGFYTGRPVPLVIDESTPR